MELKNFFAQDDQGNKLPGALCYVYRRGTESEAAGMCKANGVALINPIAADSNGLIQFAAPNGLYDVRVVSSKRDYRMPMQFSDVSDDLEAARGAVLMAQDARDAAQVTAGIADDIAEGLEKTADGDHFRVRSNTEEDSFILYKNVAGSALEINRYPSSAAVTRIRSMIQAQPSSQSYQDDYYFLDAEDNVVGALSGERIATSAIEIRSDQDSTSIGDGEGAVSIYADDKGVFLGGLVIEHTPGTDFHILDGEGAMLLGSGSEPEPEPGLVEAVSPFAGGLLFSPIIATSELHDSRIYSHGLLRRRDQNQEIVLSVSSMSSAANDTGRYVALNAARFGTEAVLNARLLSDANSRKFMPLTLVDVPVQSVPRSPKILFIGDSIGDRQGGWYLKKALEELGFTPQFIGTIEGSADVTDVWNIEGPLGECHAGWKTGDFTYSVSDRAMVVSPGGEAAYRALTKSARRERNPFLRIATAQDSASVVRNGYVFDPAFYQQRFALQTPDIVIISLGVNDALNTAMPEIRPEVAANDTLMYLQIKAAWPQAKIIRTLPGNGFNNDTNKAWVSRHAEIISALLASAKAHSNVIVAPLWAMTNPEVSYAYTQTAVDNDGFYSSNWRDSVHPVGSGRVELYQSLAPYIAAADLNLI